MKAYHSIEKNIQDYIGQFTFGFNKIDGSNFRAEWNRKLSKKNESTYGFAKFGTRNELINSASPFREAIEIFMKKYSAPLDKIFRESILFREDEKISVYAEFFGENSFAGQHVWSEPHDVVIFDMFVYKKDFVKMGTFENLFEHLGIPKIITRGVLDEDMIQNVVENLYELKEGIVFKGVIDKKVWMAKVKTQEWLDKVRALYGINNNIE